MKFDELQAAITATQAKLAKVNAEIQGKIKDLSDQINNGDVPQGVVDAMAALQTSAQTLDDIVPDAPTEPASDGEAPV